MLFNTVMCDLTDLGLVQSLKGEPIKFILLPRGKEELNNFAAQYSKILNTFNLESV
jgi:hypothetical protein